MKAYRSVKRGFTLVEILIVVIILGILAAIVIPQFTNASQDARRSSLSSTVQTLRAQIELYKLQHGDQLPDLTANWDPMIAASTFNGNSCGPYMQSTPANPMIPLAANRSSVLNAGATGTAPDGTKAFMFDYGTSGSGAGKLWGASQASDSTWSWIGD